MYNYLRRLMETLDEWRLYHGSQNKIERFANTPVYLTSDPAEATAFAHNVHRPGSAAGNPIVHSISARPGRELDIEDDEFYESLMEGDLDEYIAERAEQAKRQGYRYLVFSHPSAIDDGEFTVHISLFPQKDLTILDQ